MSKKLRVRFIHIDCHSVYRICDLCFKVQWQVILHGRWDEMFISPCITGKSPRTHVWGINCSFFGYHSGWSWQIYSRAFITSAEDNKVTAGTPGEWSHVSESMAWPCLQKYQPDSQVGRWQENGLWYIPSSAEDTALAEVRWINLGLISPRKERCSLPLECRNFISKSCLIPKCILAETKTVEAQGFWTLHKRKHPYQQLIN